LHEFLKVFVSHSFTFILKSVFELVFRDILIISTLANQSFKSFVNVTFSDTIDWSVVDYQDMKDFFYYSMIRSKDENTTKTRKLDGTVPLDELPNLMRAMGYYPTEHEVKQMKDEVMFSEYSEDGIQTTSVDMDTFIRLFVNHRPVYGIGKGNIDEAFKALVSESGND
jgi:hypothetical protein